MAKTKVEYVCSQCGHVVPKWMGRCAQCGAWNTFEERAVMPKTSEKAPERGENGVHIISRNISLKFHQNKNTAYTRTMQNWTAFWAAVLSGAALRCWAEILE
jgi:predicted ATP-dependent serine protease